MTGAVVALAIAALGAVVAALALARALGNRALAALGEARDADRQLATERIAVRDDVIEQLRRALADAEDANDRIAGACLELEGETRQVVWPARPGGSAPALVARVQGQQQQAARSLAAAQRAVAALVRPAEPGAGDGGAGPGAAEASGAAGAVPAVAERLLDGG